MTFYVITIDYQLIFYHVMFQVHLGAASSTNMDDGMSEPIILNAEPPLAILGTDSPEYTNSIELSVNSSVKPWEYLVGYSNESLSSLSLIHI